MIALIDRNQPAWFVHNHVLTAISTDTSIEYSIIARFSDAFTECLRCAVVVSDVKFILGAHIYQIYIRSCYQLAHLDAVWEAAGRSGQSTRIVMNGLVDRGVYVARSIPSPQLRAAETTTSLGGMEKRCHNQRRSSLTSKRPFALWNCAKSSKRVAKSIIGGHLKLESSRCVLRTHYIVENTDGRPAASYKPMGEGPEVENRILQGRTPRHASI
jgi:hypothetical protein